MLVVDPTIIPQLIKMISLFILGVIIKIVNWDTKRNRMPKNNFKQLKTQNNF